MGYVLRSFKISMPKHRRSQICSIISIFFLFFVTALSNILVLLFNDSNAEQISIERT
jgi:hypothetical protein